MVILNEPILTDLLKWVAGGLGTLVVVFIGLILNGIYKTLDKINDTFEVFRADYNLYKLEASQRMAKIEQKLKDCKNCPE